MVEVAALSIKLALKEIEKDQEKNPHLPFGQSQPGTDVSGLDASKIDTKALEKNTTEKNALEKTTTEKNDLEDAMSRLAANMGLQQKLIDEVSQAIASSETTLSHTVVAADKQTLLDSVTRAQRQYKDQLNGLRKKQEDA